MPLHAVFDPNSGKILRTKMCVEEIIRISDDFIGDQSNIANEKMVVTDDQGNHTVVDRPVAFDAEEININVGDTVEVVDMPAGTLLTMTRPDLEPDTRGRVRRNDIRISETGFRFMSEIAGEFTCTFRDCFPYRDQTVKIVVS